MKMDSFLKKFNLQQAAVDHCVYYSNDNGIITIVTMFVDDGLICSTHLKHIQSILRFMSNVFVTKITEPEMYIGLHLTRDRLSRTIILDQALYIQKKIIDQYGFQDCHIVSTPADPSSHLQLASNSEETADDPTFPFINIIGSLQFAAITTRADISYATSVVAAYKRRPSNAHCNAARRIIKYLKRTKHLKIIFGGLATSSPLEAYVDSDYAANRDDRKSRTGYIIYFNGGPVS